MTAGGLTEDDIDVVCSTALFGGLSRPAVVDLLAGTVPKTCEVDTFLFSAGDEADRFYVVTQGSVHLFVVDREGAETIIEIFERGDSFAEAAMFASGRFPVSAEAAAGSRVLVIDAGRFLDRLGRNPSSAMAMVASLGRWQVRLMRELRLLKSRSPAQRLAWYLVSLTETESGEATVVLPHPKHLIAMRIGIASESLSRALARFSDLGVETHGSRVRIRDVERLRRFGNGETDTEASGGLDKDQGLCGPAAR